MRFSIALGCGLWAAASIARAHGPQIQLTAESGKIVTHEIMIDTYFPLTPVKSLYVLPVALVSGQHQVQPPGTSGSGPGIAPGVGFVDAASHPFKFGGLNYSTSFVDGLFKWNGAAFVDAGDVQLQMFKTVSGSPLTITTADGAAVAGFSYSVSQAGGAEGPENSHTGMGFRFLGDGVTPGSALSDGIYLASLKVTHTPPASSTLESDPFYFLLSKGAAGIDVAAATNGFAQQKGIPLSAVQSFVAPEPTCGCLAIFSLGALAAVRRRVARPAGN